MGDIGNPGAAAFAGILSKRMSEEAASPAVIDFGEVDDENNLILNRMPGIKIPQKEYTVLEALAKREIYLEGADEDNHLYTTRPLAPGDRVLVAHVGDVRGLEAEFCVLGRFLPAVRIGEGGIAL